MTGPPILVAARDVGGRLCVEVSGELDIATSPQLEEVVTRGSGDRGVTLDLSGVRFIDAMGVRCLLRCQEAVDGLVVRNPSGVVRRLLALTRTLDLFEVEEADPSP